MSGKRWLFVVFGADGSVWSAEKTQQEAEKQLQDANDYGVSAPYELVVMEEKTA